MDNRHVDVTSEGDVALLNVLELFNQRHAVGYRVHKARFIVYWSMTDGKDITAFPFKMTMDQLAGFISAWLKEADYGKEPDHDGNNGKGWHCYNENWGHIDGQWQAFAAVEPVWAMYGK